MSISLSNLIGNGPLFTASALGTQTVSNNTNTLIRFPTVITDTNNNYNSTTFAFLPTIEGYYQINSSIQFSFSSSTGGVGKSFLYQNGLLLRYGSGSAGSTATFTTIDSVSSNLVYMNGVSDYLQIYGVAASVSGTNTISYGVFEAFLARPI